MPPVTKIIAGEVQYDVLLAHDLKFPSDSEIQQLNDDGTTNEANAYRTHVKVEG
jgi:hypothetical protein